MGRIWITFLIVSVVILSSTPSTTQALDFSQFYLPPCCYIPPQGEPYSGYASAIVSTKHEPVPAFREVLEETTNFSLSSNRTKAALPAESIRLYKLIVPIENEEETTTTTPLREDTTQLQPPTVTVENILFPDFENISEPIKSKRNSKSERTLENNVSGNQKIILLDMDEPEDSYSEKKSLSELEKKQIASHIVFHNESIPLTTISSLTEVKLMKPPGTNDKTIGDESEPLQEASSETKIYSTDSVTRKMPAVWLQNLRRALYQSLTSEKTESSNQVGSQVDTKQRNSVSKQFWRTLRKAKLKYVDKLSQSSSELPEAIYLPTGQGPIVSGVVVNSPHGVELRLASELYSAPTEGGEAREECQCSLIHHGDIVMAYWTVSRIFNEHGNPALQYLVYPLPYTVPTPPELHSFPGNDGFRPSPIDPVANFKGIYQQTNNNGLAHQNNHIGDFPNQQIPSPPYFHQLSNGHHRLEISPTPELHTTPIIPTGPSTFHSTHPQDLIKDYRGVLVENEHGYTPEFLNLYRMAILEHFRRKDAYHNKGVHYNQPEGSIGPTGIPLPHHEVIPTDLPHHHDPPVQENPNIGPTQLPLPPLTSIGPLSTHNPHYPNSIQDILAPIHPPPGPSLPPLDADNFIYPHPADGPPLPNNPPTGNYHPMRTHDKYPTKDRYPESYPKGNGKDKNRPHTTTKHPNNKDKYPYPSKYPVHEGEINPYPFPPGKYPNEGPGIEFRPASQHNIDGHDGVEGSLPYKPPYSHPERPDEPYQDRDRYDNNKIYDNDHIRPLTKGVGTAYRINDKLYYPDSRLKPYVKYSTNKLQETKKLTQEISDGTYILNF